MSDVMSTDEKVKRCKRTGHSWEKNGEEQCERRGDIGNNKTLRAIISSVR